MNQFEREPFSIYDYKVKSKNILLYDTIKKEKVRHIFKEPHNSELVGTINGVEFINDSWAHNINRTWFTLENFNKRNSLYIVLILGANRQDISSIHESITDKVKAIVLLGKDCKSIKAELLSLTKTVVSVKSMSEAVISASQLAKKGDTVLLSPGCPSFDLFKNYNDRGNKFIESVKNLD